MSPLPAVTPTRTTTTEDNARRRVLDRAYPIAKQLAEILELEVPDLAERAKALRKAIGARLADGR